MAVNRWITRGYGHTGWRLSRVYFTGLDGAGGYGCLDRCPALHCRSVRYWRYVFVRWGAGNRLPRELSRVNAVWFLLPLTDMSSVDVIGHRYGTLVRVVGGMQAGKSVYSQDRYRGQETIVVL